MQTVLVIAPFMPLVPDGAATGPRTADGAFLASFEEGGAEAQGSVVVTPPAGLRTISLAGRLESPGPRAEVLAGAEGAPDEPEAAEERLMTESGEGPAAGGGTEAVVLPAGSSAPRPERDDSAPALRPSVQGLVTRSAGQEAIADDPGAEASGALAQRGSRAVLAVPVDERRAAHGPDGPAVPPSGGLVPDREGAIGSSRPDIGMTGATRPDGAVSIEALATIATGKNPSGVGGPPEVGVAQRAAEIPLASRMGQEAPTPSDRSLQAQGPVTAATGVVLATAGPGRIGPHSGQGPEVGDHEVPTSTATGQVESAVRDSLDAGAQRPLPRPGFWERVFASVAMSPVPGAVGSVGMVDGATEAPIDGQDHKMLTVEPAVPAPKDAPDLRVRLTPAPPVQLSASGLPAIDPLPEDLADDSNLALGAAIPFPGAATGPSGVPVGPTALPVPQVASQIAAALTRTADGATELALSPEELGRVRLRMEPDAANPDRMVVMITFERPETLDLFRRHVSELAEALRSAGYAGADIGFGQEGDGSTGFGHGSGQASGTSGQDPPDTSSPLPTAPRLAAGASLDLRL